MILHQNKLVLFMPSIEGGGVEKNLFIIGNYLAKKIKNSILITADRKFNKKFKNLNIINPNVGLKLRNSRKWKYFLCLVELIKLIYSDKKITVFAFQANFYCAIVCKIFFNIKLITRSNSSPSGWSKNFLKNIIFKYLFKKIDIVIVNSYQFQKELKKKFNRKSICIYNPLNSNQIKKRSLEKIHFPFFNNRCLKIINVGRFVDQKDQITILKALNIIKNEIKFKAVIIGQGILKKKLSEFIKKNKLIGKIKLISFKQNPYKYIKLSDLFILSSKYEGLPNVLLESIVLKKYIISSNCPTGPAEILCYGKGGDLYKVGDYKTLAKKIILFTRSSRKIKLKKIKFSQSKLYRFDYKKKLNNYFQLVRSYL